MSDLKHRFEKNILSHIDEPDEKRFLLAVSGGVDSIVMVDLFRKSGYTFEIAHCNFSLRDHESDNDESLVSGLAENLNTTCHTKRFNTKSHARKTGVSIQMSARELRYEWFAELMNQNQYDFLCTAHHLNDSVETSLFNFSKGTGLKGFLGIKPRRDKYLRPLISFTKEQLLEYGSEQHLQWREDSSNQSLEYHRNFIRKKIVPLFEEINPSFVRTSENSLERLQASESLLDRFVQQLIMENLDTEGGSIIFSLSGLHSFTPSERALILHSWLSEYGYRYVQCRSISLHTGGSGKQFFSDTHVVLYDRSRLILSKHMLKHEVDVQVQPDTGKLEVAKRTLEMKSLNANEWKIQADPAISQLDFDRLKFPLRIRGWKDGDWFIPLGMKGKKKISDFMIDRKIPVNFKRELLLIESAGNIAGIIDYQIDDRFKITDDTNRVFIIKGTDAEPV